MLLAASAPWEIRVDERRRATVVGSAIRWEVGLGLDGLRILLGLVDVVQNRQLCLP
jgi:hypothetical protein